MNHTDIKSNHWIIRISPPSIRPYLLLGRFDRPIGIWLLLWPCLWSIALAAPSFTLHTFKIATLFAFGACIMRAAGCVMNDLWDKDLDAKVERTKHRPLAAGIISPKRALMFLAGLLFVGLIILIQLPVIAIILGFCVMPLVALYPLMKRITWWPQAFLGLTFNFGALMGWAAIQNTIAFESIALYICGIFWTLGYDTIYAHQDKDDDMMIGIKSTALKFGGYSKLWCAGFYALSLIALGIASQTIWIVLPAAHFAWQIKIWQTDKPDSALRIFKSNAVFGALVLLCCLAATGMVP